MKKYLEMKCTAVGNLFFWEKKKKMNQWMDRRMGKWIDVKKQTW